MYEEHSRFEAFERFLSEFFILYDFDSIFNICANIKIHFQHGNEKTFTFDGVLIDKGTFYGFRSLILHATCTRFAHILCIIIFIFFFFFASLRLLHCDVQNIGC